MSIKNILFIFVLQFLNVLCQKPQFSCATGAVSKNGEYCLLKNLNTVGAFVPSAKNPSLVKEFEIKNSSVLRLTRDICNVFPNIEKFTVSEVGVERVDEDTFWNCQKIREIRLLRNHIPFFERQLFNRNPSIELLYFGVNQLTAIPDEMFYNLRNLRDLGFASMNFTKFPKNAFKDLKNLEVLWVYHDALMDLDIEDILEAAPMLNKVYIRDNDFNCDRLEVILTALQAKNITIDPSIWEGNERYRNPKYPVSKRTFVECYENDVYKQVELERQRLNEDTVNRFSGNTVPLTTNTPTRVPTLQSSNSDLSSIEKQIKTLKDGFEYRINEMKTQHKNEMDDLKEKLSIMHQNLEGKMDLILQKMNEHHQHHGNWKGNWPNKMPVQGSQQ